MDLGFPSRGMKTFWNQTEMRDGMRWLDGVTGSVDINLSELGDIVKEGKSGVLQSEGSQSPP